MFLTLVLGAFTDRLMAEDPWIVLWAVGFGVLGLDWRFAPRLRARVVCSGLVIVPLVGADEPWAYPGAAAWFLGAVATLWLIERDIRRAATRPVPLVPRSRPGIGAGDLIRTAVMALLVGSLVALLFADTTCTWTRDMPTVSAPDSGTGAGAPGAGGRQIPQPPASLDPDALYELDPGTGSLSPGGDAADRIPVPGSVGNGRSIGRDEQGRPMLRQPDGSIRTYGRDGSGRDVVIVEDDDGRRTYLYEDTDDGLRITEYGEDGSVTGQYLYDPSGGAGSDSNTRAEAGRSPSAPPEAPDDGSERSWWPWILAAILVVAAAIVVAMSWRPRNRTRPTPPRSWAERLATRLDDEGRRRGRGRAPDETVVEHADALADGPLPDHRLTTVGRIVSAALFGRTQPPEDARTWVESVVDEAIATNPPPSRRDRRRRSHATAGASSDVLPPDSSR
jgi:hypothetical protein